jgi:hypothetical protein
LNIAITTWDELTGGNMYPTTLSTPSESAQYPLPIGSLTLINPPSLPFAGLEANQGFDPEDCSAYGSVSARSSPSSIGSYDNPIMRDLSEYGRETASSPKTLHSRDDMPLAGSMDQPTYNTFDTVDDRPTDWELLFNSDQLTTAGYQQTDLGSPIQGGSDPGDSDVALN